jgi:3-oxoadipate enol-lactonase
MAHLTTGGVSLHYERTGVAGAQTLILSTSLGATMAMWEPQRAVFEDRFDLVRYDMRGHGGSSAPEGPYSIEMLAGDVLALIDALNVRDAVFCGISIGGAIGQSLAMHASDRFRGFVLSNTAAKIGTPEGWAQRIAAVEQDGLGPLAERIVSGWLTAPFREAHPEVVEGMREMLAGCDSKGYMATCAAVRDFDFREGLHRVQKPVRIIAGLHDVSTTVADARFLQEHIQGSSLVKLDAAHISNVEAPHAFADAVIEFADLNLRG